MICAQVIGHDSAITWACASGNFELNTMMPLLAYDILDSIGLLAAGSRNFATRCIDGLKANRDKMNKDEGSTAMATALAPAIGYDRAAAIAKEVAQSGRPFLDVAIEKSGLSRERLESLLRKPS